MSVLKAYKGYRTFNYKKGQVQFMLVGGVFYACRFLGLGLGSTLPIQVYYVGGRLGSWSNDHETLGFTHPFFHDLRSRGTGIVYHEVRGGEL